MRIKFVLLIVLVSFTLGCKTQPKQVAPFDPTLVSPEILELHGDDRLQVLLYPDQVHSYRTQKIYDRKPGEKDYSIVTQGPDLSNEQIDHLRRLYVDMRGYDDLRRYELERYFPYNGFRVWGSGCEWKPDVVYEYERGESQVRVVICFGCSVWAFESDGKRYGSFGFAEDQRSSGLQPMLRATAIELFPEMMNYIPTHKY